MLVGVAVHRNAHIYRHHTSVPRFHHAHHHHHRHYPRHHRPANTDVSQRMLCVFSFMCNIFFSLHVQKQNWHWKTGTAELPLEVWWWMKMGWGHWENFVDWDPCCEFSSVFWRHCLGDRKGVWSVKIIMFSEVLFGNKLRKRCRFTWQVAVVMEMAVMVFSELYSRISAGVDAASDLLPEYSADCMSTVSAASGRYRLSSTDWVDYIVLRTTRGQRILTEDHITGEVLSLFQSLHSTPIPLYHNVYLVIIVAEWCCDDIDLLLLLRLPLSIEKKMKIAVWFSKFRSCNEVHL